MYFVIFLICMSRGYCINSHMLTFYFFILFPYTMLTYLIQVILLETDQYNAAFPSTTHVTHAHAPITSLAVITSKSELL